MTLITWIVYIITRAVIDYTTIEKQKEKIDHGFNAFITIIIAFSLAYLVDTKPFYIVFPCLMISYWFIFDTLLNILRGKPLWYLGKTSVLDRLQLESFGAGTWFFWKFILTLGLISIYIFNY